MILDIENRKYFQTSTLITEKDFMERLDELIAWKYIPMGMYSDKSSGRFGSAIHKCFGVDGMSDEGRDIKEFTEIKTKELEKAIEFAINSCASNLGDQILYERAYAKAQHISLIVYKKINNVTYRTKNRLKNTDRFIEDQTALEIDKVIFYSGICDFETFCNTLEITSKNKDSNELIIKTRHLETIYSNIETYYERD